MKNYFLLALFFLIGVLQAQFYEGSIMDMSGNAVANAVIYYPNSSVSVQSNQAGLFKIKKLALAQELIISHPDYGIETLALDEFSEQPIEIVLEEKIILSQTVAMGISKEDRQFYLAQFKAQVIGKTKNGLKAKILNQEVLRFHWDKSSKILTAYADEALNIENPNLGYSIHYDLVQFTYDMGQNKVIYAGFPLFKNLKNKVRNRQQKARDKAYYGSLQHFLKMLYQDKFYESGFRVKRIEERPNPNYPSDSALAKARTYLKNHRNVDMNDPELLPIKQASMNTKTVFYLYPELLKRDDFTIQNGTQLFIDFKDKLDVEYIYEKETQEYIQILPFKEQAFVRNQSSLLWNIAPVEIFENGTHTPTDALWVADYLSFEKLADMLPSDYAPKD